MSRTVTPRSSRVASIVYETGPAPVSAARRRKTNGNRRRSAIQDPHEFFERVNFRLRQAATAARFETFERQRSESDSPEPGDFVAHRFEDPPDLPVPSFVNRHLQ